VKSGLATVLYYTQCGWCNYLGEKWFISASPSSNIISSF